MPPFVSTAAVGVCDDELLATVVFQSTRPSASDMTRRESLASASVGAPAAGASRLATQMTVRGPGMPLYHMPRYHRVAVPAASSGEKKPRAKAPPADTRDCPARSLSPTASWSSADAHRRKPATARTKTAERDRSIDQVHGKQS